MKKQKVLVAMSGGVDSSVAALLMKQKGYEVIGAFMKNWSHSKDDYGQCAWRGERKFAMKIATMLDIPLITLDFEKQYKKQVVEEMFKDYKKGITPNPDVTCNDKVKFPLLLKAAKKLKADYLVTGHYSRIKETKVSLINPSFKLGVKPDKKTKEKYELLRAKDESKDQSYFLYKIKQKELSQVLFPIGDYTKTQVRQIAKMNNFPNHDKKSTVGICFIGKINLKDFLKKKIKQKKGKILDPEGNIIGFHDGVYYYTIGQRLGPRYGFEIKRKISGTPKNEGLKKWYVAKKDVRKNILVLAPEGHPINYKKEIFIKNSYWISEIPKNNLRVYTRIRQVGELLPSKLIKQKNKLKVILNKSITGISEGQAIVLYKGKKCLGGGEIRYD